MKKAINDVVDKYLDPNASIAPTPATEDLFEEPHDNSPIMSSKQFLSCLMSLMYIARLTKPEILLSVSYLATRAQKVTQCDLKKLNRILRYLKATVNEKLIIKCDDLQIGSHCDSSHGSHPSGHSHTGFNIWMGKTQSFLLAKSYKQKVSSGTASTDTEIIALTDCVKMLVWLRNLLQELDICRLRSAIVFQDNQSALILITGQESKVKRMKHLLTKIVFNRILYSSGVIEPRYLHTRSMTADLLTKPIQGQLFVDLKSQLRGNNSN